MRCVQRDRLWWPQKVREEVFPPTNLIHCIPGLAQKGLVTIKPVECGQSTVITEIFVRVKSSCSGVRELSYAVNFVLRWRCLLHWYRSSSQNTKNSAIGCFMVVTNHQAGIGYDHETACCGIFRLLTAWSVPDPGFSCFADSQTRLYYWIIHWCYVDGFCLLLIFELSAKSTKYTELRGRLKSSHIADKRKNFHMALYPSLPPQTKVWSTMGEMYEKIALRCRVQDNVNSNLSRLTKAFTKLS